GRNTMGEKDQLEKLTIDAAKTDFKRRYRARGSILALAGNLEFERVKDLVQQSLGDWQGGEAIQIQQTPPPGNFRHEPQQSEQTHIGIAYPSLPETHADYYTLRLAMEILSGG